MSINFTVPNQSRSRDEAAIAAAAAAGAKTIKYAPGEKPKTPKHCDIGKKPENRLFIIPLTPSNSIQTRSFL